MSESPFVTLDERFNALHKGSARLEHLFTGCRWAEGPAWFPAHRSLVWSDIPNDRILRWDETTGQVGVFRHPAGYTNGHTVDPQGRLVSCEHGNRRVTRTEHDGAITVIADRFEGKRLNSPNDIVVRSDGSIWFTDPPYGIESDYEGHKGEPEIGGNYVYRVDPTTGDIRVVADDFDRPNGLAFSTDESRLYVTDTGPNAPRHMRVFDVTEEGTLTNGRVFANATNGGFDGFRFDDAGNVWTSAADGIHCIHPDGTLLGKVLVPEGVANCVFGGAKRNRLFIAATTSLYSIMLPVNGAKTF
ncbi:MAG: SMP-30/gluconolactonase/LRE family protein [Thermomicrobiales bacterium]